MKRFAVIDTETTWHDKVMSIGVVIADSDTKEVIEGKYYMLDPEYKSGGMYSGALRLPGIKETFITSREQALEEIKVWLKKNDVTRIMAYNGNFDRSHLPELISFTWCDIMKIAAYKQYNKKIPSDAPCCATGRLKSGYGVEPILRLLSDDKTYHETHNAYFDSVDELRIVKLLGYDMDTYDNAILGVK